MSATSNCPIDFFIIGAPKSGTTALDTYLSEHPDIFTGPKEMHYFMTEWPEYQKHFKNLENYFSAFEKAAPHQIKGDSSVFYLYSEEALRNILAHNPKARMIIMLRNPVEMIHSYYYQVVKTLREDLPFEEALAKEDQRDLSQYADSHAATPQLYRYRWICTPSPHVARAMEIVPANQLKIIFYDDLKNDPKQVYDEVLAFLRVRPHDRDNFEIINPRAGTRSKRLRAFLINPPQWVMRTWYFSKPFFRLIGLEDLKTRIKKLNEDPGKTEPLKPETRQSLVNAFSTEIDRLGTLLNRDLSHWKSP